MRNEKPTISRTARMCLSEVARYLGCDRKTVRAYSQRYAIHPTINLANGKAIYTGEQILRLWYMMM